ncbi:unnamed protein product [Hyaloperonospora brassicae]|uniref:RxLR effector candidate protein n=1 Tax=Hyaloperonospora brassicae TaxID=162125 RepID=A0AAV0TEQ1_HYABA|nr:unnamed protein product [Hyaloperonospora brassicae]
MSPHHIVVRLAAVVLLATSTTAAASASLRQREHSARSFGIDKQDVSKGRPARTDDNSAKNDDFDQEARAALAVNSPAGSFTDLFMKWGSSLLHENAPAGGKPLMGLGHSSGNELSKAKLDLLLQHYLQQGREMDVTATTILNFIPVSRLAEMEKDYPGFNTVISKAWVKEGKSADDVMRLLELTGIGPKIMDHPNLGLYIRFRYVLNEKLATQKLAKQELARLSQEHTR